MMGKDSFHYYQSKKFEEISIYTQHTEALISKILNTIRDYNPAIFVELGTFQGGVTLTVHEEFPKLKIYSFDRRNYIGNKVISRIFGNNVHFLFGDILRLPKEEKRKPYFENSIDRTKTIIEVLNNEPGKILLYCDNGEKAKEINLFSKYLKIGDVIGCHDWLTEVFPELIEEAIKDFELLENWSENYVSRFWVKVRE